MAKDVATKPLTEKLGEVTIDLEKAKTFIFRLTPNKKVKSQGKTETGDVDIEYPPKYWIDNPAAGLTTVDPDTKKPRLLRCLKGYEDIFVDQQTKLGKLEPAQINNLLESFLMLDGELYLTLPADYSKLKFLLLNPKFDKNAQANGVDAAFYLVNDDAVADAEYGKMKLRTEAEEKAIDLEIGKLESVASYFGVRLLKDDKVTKRSENAIRLDLAKRAAAQPEVFLKALEDERLRIRHAVSKAITDGLIDLNKVKGQAHWGETGAIITILNGEKEPLDALTDFALGTKADNKSFANKLGL